MCVHAVSPVDVPSNNSKRQGPCDAGHCAVFRKAFAHYQVDGSQEAARRRIASSFAPHKRMSRRQLDHSGAPCALAEMEAQSVHELY